VSLGRNDPCPCGSGKKFKTCHADQLVALRRILGEKFHAALVVHGERLRCASTLLSEEEDALHRMVEANAALMLTSSHDVGLDVARVAGKHLAVWLWEKGNPEVVGVKLVVSDEVATISVLDSSGDVKVMDLTGPPPQWQKRSGRPRGVGLVARTPARASTLASRSIASSVATGDRLGVRGFMSASVALMARRNFASLPAGEMVPSFARYVRKWFREESPEVRAAVDALLADGLAERFCAAMDAADNETADAEMEKLSSIVGLSKRFLETVEREAAARLAEHGRV